MSNIHEEIKKKSLDFIRKNKSLKVDYKQKGSTGYLSPRVSSEFMDCSMPMTFDSYSHCSLGCAYCCVAGTKVLMATGKEKSIERIRSGESVINYNEERERFERSIIKKTMRRKNAEKIIVLHVENKIIEITPEHPVLTKEHGWVAAGELTENDEIMLW